VTTNGESVAVAGRRLRVTNLAKVLWPEDGITKAELIDYYTRIAPYLLPYLKDRPVVLTRYPGGIHGKWFYHKDTPKGAPDWIPTWPHETEDGRVIHYLLVSEPASLTYLANLGAIEVHPWLSRHLTPDSPDWAVIDLDPSEGNTFADVVLLARLVQQILDAVGITGFPKLSGATGIHIYCPCGSGYTYAETAEFCERIGQLLLQVYPAKVTLERMVARRTDKIYVDYLQNRRGQTITAIYGLRPQRGAPVSAPVTWSEIQATPPRFTMQTIWQRLADVGDLHAPMLGMAQDLRRATLELQRML
jgi:bifunctional non-homologous end joining protein LigD